jgi:predicted outer membrane protein
MQRARFLDRWLLGAAALAAFAGAAVAPLGCSSDSLANGAASPPAPADVTSTSAPLFAVCSDGQILAILAAEFAARVDIANGVRAALGSASALDLAEKILTDDSVLEVQVQGEMRETGIATVPGGVDRAIAAESLETTQALGAESATAIDASYVDREVLAHLRALGLIDQRLAPSAHDPRVRDLIARVRDVVVQDAQAASQAEAAIEGPCASSSTSSE